MNLLNKDINNFLNYFAEECFLIQADGDYIIARLSFRLNLYSQFQWSSLQAIEKYIKAILLFNRINSKSMRHNLLEGLKLINKLDFVNLSKVTTSTIEHFNIYGNNRYFTNPYFEDGLRLFNLDFTVWELRRYCRSLDPKFTHEDDKKIEKNLKVLAESNFQNPRSGYLEYGNLEKIIKDKKNPARKYLVWHNPFFRSNFRRTVKVPNLWIAKNSPLSNYPEYADILSEYVQISKEELSAYKLHSIKKK